MTGCRLFNGSFLFVLCLLALVSQRPHPLSKENDRDKKWKYITNTVNVLLYKQNMQTAKTWYLYSKVSHLGQKKLMNSFSGQISEILMRQAGDFFLLLLLFFLLKISLQSVCRVTFLLCTYCHMYRSNKSTFTVIPTLLGFKI